MNEAQAREGHFASMLLVWIASAPNLRRTHIDCKPRDVEPWQVCVVDGPWRLTVEGQTFADCIRKLFDVPDARAHGFDEHLGE